LCGDHTDGQLGGIAIATVTNGQGAPPQGTFNGVVFYNNATVGAELTAGVKAKFRGSRFYNNTIGVRLNSSAGAVSNGVSGIDFGTSALGSSLDAGKNVLQSAVNMGQNSGVGLCVSIANNNSQPINFMGNTWIGTVSNGAPQQYDCTATAAQLTKTNAQCNTGGGASYGGNGLVGNTLNVQGCTP
jgi:hypothetical protein